MRAYIDDPFVFDPDPATHIASLGNVLGSLTRTQPQTNLG